jgi:endogenous inhibitor of DNA gyrase (YacG/DUF329 family)
LIDLGKWLSEEHGIPSDGGGRQSEGSLPEERD